LRALSRRGPPVQIRSHALNSAEFDDRAATATFDALERSILLAVSQEYEVAAEYAETLLYKSVS
jgi:hypothetical protein